MTLSSRRPFTATSLTVVTLATLMTVSGCSIPGIPGPTGAPPAEQVAVVQPIDTPATTEPTPETGEKAATPEEPTPETGEETATPEEPAWVPVAGDLSQGSTTHTLGAAAHNLVVDYWMTDDATQLTPDDAPIIRLSARIEGDPYGNTIKVTRFNARALGVDLVNDQGDFIIQPPYSYSSGVVVPVNPTARSTDIVFTFDLLTETAPGSGHYTRQTVLDTLTLGYALPGATAQD